MQHVISTWRFTAGALGFILLAATACKRAPAPVAHTPNPPGPGLSPEQAKQQRLAWNLKTLVDPYESAGHTSPKWDEAARRSLIEFARVRAEVIETNEPYGQIIATNCERAVQAGCGDPMIAYLHTKFFLNQTNRNEVFAAALGKAANDMQPGAHSSIRKFYACFRSAQQIEYTWGTNHASEMEYFMNLAITNLGAALRDRSMPVTEVDDACHEAADKLLQNKKHRHAFYYEVEVFLFNNWTNASVCWLLQGDYFIDAAWAKRGGGYASTVTEEGWKSFAENLTQAEKCLARAWELNPNDPRIPTKMLTVELGQGKERDRMELWFNRAMELNPDNYDACHAKRYYLEPKWHGSREEMLAFGRECVESKVWGGKVPLTLSDAHEALKAYLEKSEQSDYWKRPEVWPDIEMAFEKFFKLNPNETRWLHNYARYAYRCEQWDKFNELLPKLGPINYDFFGGRAEFDEMIAHAKAHAGRAKAEETR